jgi:hypothetical protein
LYARGAYVPERERRAIERAAGLPGFRERSERFKHRMRRRAEPPARPNREEARQERLF